MLTKEDRKKIKEGIIGVDGFKFHRSNGEVDRKGEITAMRSYFYRFDMSPEKLWEIVHNAFPNAELLEKGDHFHGFVGGSKLGSATDSFMWVRFK